MRQLLQSKALRQLTLIEMLLSSEEPLELNDVSEILDSSVRTIQMDISEINTVMPFLEIYISLGQVYIKHDENTGYSHIHHYFLRHDVNFNILHDVFFEEGITITQLSQRLFISEASIYRAIRSINKSLKQLGFGFKINKTPCSLIGDEVEIRRFYYQLIFESYSIIEWPFEFIDFEAYTKALQLIAKEFKIQLYLSNMQKLSIFVGVNLVRHINDHYLNNLVPTDFFDKEKIALRVAELLTPAIEGLDKTHWTAEDTLNVFFPFFTVHYAYNYQYFIQKSEENDVFNHSFLWINHMIETLRANYKIHFTDTKSLILSLHNNACLALLTPGALPVLGSSPLKAVQIVLDWSPNFYAVMRDLVENYLKSVFHQEDAYVVDYVLFQFIVHLQDYLEIYMSEDHQIRLAVISDYNNTHAQYYRRLIQSLMPKQLDIQIIDDYINIHQILLEGDYDILVSSFIIDVPEHTRLCKLSLIPTSEELVDLMTVLQDVRVKKAFPGK